MSAGGLLVRKPHNCSPACNQDLTSGNCFTAAHFPPDASAAPYCWDFERFQFRKNNNSRIACIIGDRISGRMSRSWPPDAWSSGAWQWRYASCATPGYLRCFENCSCDMFFCGRKVTARLRLRPHVTRRCPQNSVATESRLCSTHQCATKFQYGAKVTLLTRLGELDSSCELTMVSVRASGCWVRVLARHGPCN
jgi:hypothetical protein